MRNPTERTLLSAKVPATEGAIRSEDLGVAPGGMITTRNLHGGRQEGVLEVVINAGDMAVSVIPTRGAGIWWAKYKGKHLFWKSPVKEAVHPMYVQLQRNGGLGWLDGFCEGMVRCGLAFNGAPGRDEIVDDRGEAATVDLPVHGLIANIPASTVCVAGLRHGNESLLSVRCVHCETSAQCDKYQLIARTDVRIGGNEIFIHDQVTNLSRERRSPLELLYHVNFGGTALGKGSSMVFKGEVVPRDERAAEGLRDHARFAGRLKGFTEQCYFIDLAARPNGRTGAMLVNAKRNFAVYELHDKKQLKCFTQWKQLGRDEYVNGFEPGTDLPNCRQEERRAGRLEYLAPGETRRFDLTLGALDRKAAIEAMARRLQR